VALLNVPSHRGVSAHKTWMSARPADCDRFLRQVEKADDDTPLTVLLFTTEAPTAKNAPPLIDTAASHGDRRRDAIAQAAEGIAFERLRALHAECRVERNVRRARGADRRKKSSWAGLDTCAREWLVVVLSPSCPVVVTPRLPRLRCRSQCRRRWPVAPAHPERRQATARPAIADLSAGIAALNDAPSIQLQGVVAIGVEHGHAGKPGIATGNA
jgi:hypothetical protein